MTVRTTTAPARRQTLTPRRRRFGLRSRRSLVGWAFIAPAAALIAVFTLIPFVQAILLSFQEWDGVSPDTPWVGFANYVRVFQNQIFWGSMQNAVIFGLVGLIIGNALSLGMAIAVNNTRRLKAFFRTAFYLPGIFSVVVIGFMFSWLLDPKIGIINQALNSLGLSALAHNWLGDPATALPTIAVVFVWYHWGFGFILFLAGLQDIPPELYEAASLDGAGAWARFRHITWPQLAPVTAVVGLLSFLAALQIFGTVQILTNGGPGYHTMVPTLLIYNEAFTNHRYGSAAAMSVIFGGALVILAFVQQSISRRRARS